VLSSPNMLSSSCSAQWGLPCPAVAQPPAPPRLSAAQLLCAQLLRAQLVLLRLRQHHSIAQRSALEQGITACGRSAPVKREKWGMPCFPHKRAPLLQQRSAGCCCTWHGPCGSRAPARATSGQARRHPSAMLPRAVRRHSPPHPTAPTLRPSGPAARGGRPLGVFGSSGGRQAADPARRRCACRGGCTPNPCGNWLLG
jgi:hypothetical protein